VHVYYLTGGDNYHNGVRVNGFAIDVRAEGGYVIAPSGPRSGRRWIRSPLGPWALAPAWLRDQIGAETKRRRRPQLRPILHISLLRRRTPSLTPATLPTEQKRLSGSATTSGGRRTGRKRLRSTTVPSRLAG
jgi:hypothetical protein